MPSRKLEDLIPELADAYKLAVAEYEKLYPNSPQPFITCTYRSAQEQNELFAIGRTKPGKKVTNARAMSSPHNYLPSYAFDIAFLGLDKKLDWNKLHFGRFAKIIKGVKGRVTCGIDFVSLVDPPHFELTNWKNLVKSNV
jgi:peptidoglycan L-alanyl-D-glutamate endopeptidase CwlK